MSACTYFRYIHISMHCQLRLYRWLFEVSLILFQSVYIDFFIFNAVVESDLAF